MEAEEMGKRAFYFAILSIIWAVIFIFWGNPMILIFTFIFIGTALVFGIISLTKEKTGYAIAAVIIASISIAILFVFQFFPVGVETFT